MAMCPNQLAGVAPGGRPADLFLLRFSHLFVSTDCCWHRGSSPTVREGSFAMRAGSPPSPPHPERAARLGTPGRASVPLCTHYHGDINGHHLGGHYYRQRLTTAYCSLPTDYW